MEKSRPTDEELRTRLSPLAYEVTQQKGTERAFTGAYTYNKEHGVYRCVVCNADLFESDTQFDSGSGWPSFWTPLAGNRVREHVDSAYGMRRTEVVCGNCGAHLGHVFPDGPKPTGLRYCINSVALQFAPADQADRESASPSTSPSP